MNATGLLNLSDYYLSTLPNGLKVVTVPMKARDSASVALWVRAGSRYESAKLAGMSHFLEHMVFKGTKRRSARRIKEEIEGVGGMLNAFTGEESTCFFAKVLARHFPSALDVLADMLQSATLSPREFDKEKTVILEEIKMYRDLPSHHVFDMMGEMLWPNQPLGRPISGSVESVTALTRAQMADFRDEYYHPKNIVLSASGPVDHDDLMALAKKYFSRQPKRSQSRFEPARESQSRPRSAFMEKPSEQTHFVLGFHGLSRYHPSRYVLGLLNVILGGNMSSRLFEELREKRGLAYEVRTGTSFYKDAGSFTISAGVDHAKAARSVRVILDELAKIAAKAPSEGELRRAKDYFLGQLCLAIEDTLEHLLWVGERALEKDSAPDKEKIRHYIDAVTPGEIRDMAKKIFQTAKLNFALIGPVDAKAQAAIKKELEIRGR